MKKEEEYTGNTKGNEWHGDNLKKGIDELIGNIKQGGTWDG